MAGKKSSGKHYTSKGIVGVNKKISNAIRSERSSALVMLNKLRAYQQGKNVVFTIENPNPNETNKKFIRVSARVLLGDPRERATFKIA